MGRMPIYAVQYDYDVNSASLRDQHRPAHRDYLSRLTDEGSVLARGPYADNAGGPGALLIMRADSPEEIARLLDADPFFEQGCISSRRVREWDVLGDHPFT